MIVGALFIVAAGFGAATRHGVAARIGWWQGTITVNLIGSFVLGWLVGADVASDTMLVAGTAFFGSLTTFSGFSLDATEGSVTRRVTVIAATLVLGLLAATVGYSLG